MEQTIYETDWIAVLLESVSVVLVWHNQCETYDFRNCYMLFGSCQFQSPPLYIAFTNAGFKSLFGGLQARSCFTPFDFDTQLNIWRVWSCLIFLCCVLRCPLFPRLENPGELAWWWTEHGFIDIYSFLTATRILAFDTLRLSNEIPLWEHYHYM